ncbi:HCL104Wp [Eremothecium sinecaudum]|uniref:HCL104Wp n=1 Tax=Eremothecium sinecaudum TaxID=45286 RepID=A0A0X8HRD2_9SACH|nr:HCL104Wp [Eremothecium sinecaudum]AMD20047.1 HCL104Wp [Eremothecium sinecaudum]
MGGISRIKALDSSVVNKIAAGEIIISPVNALKEMLENSIDAGATNIDIVVKSGGLRMLQITDNGSGIMKDDLAILCERFTTSKLTTFDDLAKIQTYGFRGEALASISHISKITVVTKVNDDVCAWKASYENGKMVDGPKPTAGKNGTVILVQDLFYNVPSRLRSMRSESEEYSKILDVVSRYAINTNGVGFSCKKHGEAQFTLTVRSNASCVDRINVVFGSQVSNSLLEINLPDIEAYGVTKVSGYVSNFIYNNKKGIPAIFFINNRLVSCDPLRRSLLQLYSNYLAKGNKPFIYLSLMIASENVDVNIHPTKREVRFLHEDDIIERIHNGIQDQLSKLDTSRSFKAGSLLSDAPSLAEVTTKPSPMTPAMAVKRKENRLIRTDSSQYKITNFLRSSQTSTSTIFATTARDKTQRSESKFSDKRIDASSGADNRDEASKNPAAKDDSTVKTLLNNTYNVVENERIAVNLKSIKCLKEDVDRDIHEELTGIFADMTYVGLVDETRRLASIQHGLKLFLVDYGSLCNELFYQIGLTEFANFGKIYLHEIEGNEGVPLVSLLSQIDSLEESKATEITKQLWSMREMLDDYFSIELIGDKSELENVRICCIPLLLKDYTPPLSKLPLFLYRMGTKVDWSSEKECLEGILKQLALLYVPEIIEHVDTDDETIDEETRIQYISRSEYLKNVLENVVFPTIKKRLLAPKKLLKDVIEIANLPGLYRVFERC